MESKFSLKKTQFAFIASMFLVLSCWALSVPPGGTPDEGYHVASIYCARGVVPGKCQKVVGESELGSAVVVPYLSDYCFHRGPEISASCLQESSGNTLIIQSRFPGSDLRNIYYWIQNTFSGTNTYNSVIAMRFANIFLFILVLSLVLRLNHSRLRRAALIGIVLSLVPQGVYLISSVNPSSWALTGVSSNWVFFCYLRNNSIKSSKTVSWVGYLLTLTLTLARLDSLGFVVFTTICVLLFTKSPSKVSKSMTLFFGALGSLAVFVILYFNFAEAFLSQLKVAFSSTTGSGFLWYWFIHIVDIPAFSFGFNYQDFGPLGGSLEVLMPPIVAIIQIGLFTLLALCLIKCYSRKLLVFHFLTFIFLYSVLIQQLSAEMTYNPYWVQGRYILPLIPFLIGFSLQLVKSELQLPSRAQMKLLAGLLSLSHAIAFLTLVQRYSIGSVRSLTNPFSFEWSYFPALPAVVVWSMGSLGFLSLLYFGTNVLTPVVNVESSLIQNDSQLIDDQLV